MDKGGRVYVERVGELTFRDDFEHVCGLCMYVSKMIKYGSIMTKLTFPVAENSKTCSHSPALR